jgi:ABC-type molybdate transport system substrate-binding protein
MCKWTKIVAAGAACVAVLIAPPSIKAAEISLMTTAAVEQIMRDLIPPFEQATGHKVVMSVFGTGPAVAKIKDGTFADLILLGLPALDELAKAGKVDAATIKPHFSRCGPVRQNPILALPAPSRRPSSTPSRSVTA